MILLKVACLIFVELGKAGNSDLRSHLSVVGFLALRGANLVVLDSIEVATGTV